MINDKILLSKKRSRQKSHSNSHQNYYKDSPMFEIEGFNVIELLYIESLSNNKFSESEEIELKESNNKKLDSLENASLNKDIITRTRLKEIEDHYVSQYGIEQVNENCFRCLMTNFMSNELLYFRSRQNLFDYCKHCFVNKKKKIFLDQDIYQQNKEQFFSVNQNFVSSWRFFIPKTICKGCFMQLINQKDIIYSLKNIFSDTDIDSSCKTNYRNYAKFSKSFRKTFSIGITKSKSKKNKSHNINDVNKKSKLEMIELSDSETVDINNSIKKINKEKNKYNPEVEYDRIKNIIYINKSIMNIQNNINEKNSKEKNKSKTIKYKRAGNNNNAHGETINNIINFQGKNYINIINHININSDNSINNNNLIRYDIELMIDKIKNFNLDFKKFTDSLKNLITSLNLIYYFVEVIIKKLYQLFIYPALLKKTTIPEFCNYLFFNFEDKKNLFFEQLFHLKKNYQNIIDFTDNIHNKINNNFSIKENVKKELLRKVNNIKFYLNENIKFTELYEKPINNFIDNFDCLLNLIYKITSKIS